jgi:hypothetical protein
MIAPQVELLRRIVVPTLHIDPSSIYESPWCKRGARVVELIPHATNIEIPDTDDNIAEFSPGELAQAVQSFLAQHPVG